MNERLSGPWAATLPVVAGSAIARLRLIPGVQAAVDNSTLWLRGDRHDDSIRRALEQVAPSDIYDVRSDGTLVRIGESLPERQLPELSWVPVAKFVCVTMPPSRLAGVIRESVPLTLVPSDRPRLANALLTTVDSFAAWANDAPSFRFRPLRYAVSGDDVLVVGEPIPSIDGVRLYENDGICVPCGFAISPAIDAASIRAILALTDKDVALFTAAGWHHILGDAMTAVSRASVRLLANGRAR